MQKERTMTELFDLLQTQFQKIDDRFDLVDDRFDLVDERFDHVFGKLDDHDGRLDRIEKTMVTKQYVDYKIADLKGDLLLASQRVVNKLEEKNILTAKDATYIFSN